ncbi:hypothetical protein ON010_g15597 [Phytophthora cinnamomi]|nr:hypothetical protein ON010_g15597 [Phytophthora cinnamomi]
MRGLAVAVPWKDVYAQGLQGIIEVRDSDVRALKEKEKKQPNGSNEMTVGDLVDVLNEKLKPIAHEDGGVRFVEAIYLYGTHEAVQTSHTPLHSSGCFRRLSASRSEDAFRLQSQWRPGPQRLEHHRRACLRLLRAVGLRRQSQAENSR